MQIPSLITFFHIIWNIEQSNNPYVYAHEIHSSEKYGIFVDLQKQPCDQLCILFFLRYQTPRPIDTLILSELSCLSLLLNSRLSFVMNVIFLPLWMLQINANIDYYTLRELSFSPPSNWCYMKYFHYFHGLVHFCCNTSMPFSRQNVYIFSCC